MSRRLLITATTLAMAVGTAHAFDFGAAVSGAAGDSKTAAVNAGVSGMMSGQSATDAAKAAMSAGASAAKTSVSSKMPSTGTSTGGGLTSQIQTDASKRISVKDRAAIAKHFAISKLGNKLLGTTAAASNLPADYNDKLVVNSPLDASLQGVGTVVDPTTITGLSAQPSGTQLIQIGKKVVKVDTSTSVVLDVTPI